MATVYLARELKHDRLVALKVIQPDLATGLAPSRFLREIRTAARLNHPHILGVLDSGEAGGLLWYTMPYVDGDTLRARLRRDTRLELSDVAAICGQIANALTYAHSEGVVHRDVKPENILFSRGHALLADFGIAKVLSDAETPRSAHPTLTATGFILCTPSYISPEQAGGERELDGRSDVYSLACVVYEMLTGTPPFSADTVLGLIVKHLTQDPPPFQGQEIPEFVSVAVSRALAKEPGQRFASAVEFASALAASSPSSAQIVSVAITDFTSLSEDPGYAWIGTGIADSLAADLQKTSALPAIARDRIAQALAARKLTRVSDSQAITLAAELGAAWIITGIIEVSALGHGSRPHVQ